MDFNVKAKELATILGLTTRRINQLAKESILEKDSKGFFSLTHAVPAYIVYASIENDELRQEKILHERAKRKKAEIDLAHLENRMHVAADIEMAVTGMLVTFRNRVLSIPQKLAPRLIGLTNLTEIISILDVELREALTELSEYDPAMFGHAAAGENEHDT